MEPSAVTGWVKIIASQYPFFTKIDENPGFWMDEETMLQSLSVNDGQSAMIRIIRFVSIPELKYSKKVETHFDGLRAILRFANMEGLVEKADDKSTDVAFSMTFDHISSEKTLLGYISKFKNTSTSVSKDLADGYDEWKRSKQEYEKMLQSAEDLFR
jgi:Asp-tRNA(Asn)/Glu-tRNA(Gln) amidotransferase B subunit